MKEKRSITEKIAASLQNAAVQVTRQTVGKSFPFACHELEISEDLWEWVKEQEQSTGL